MTMLPVGPPPHRVEVRDHLLTRLGVVDDFNLLEVVMTFNAVGRWQLDVPTTCAQLANLTAAGSGILVIREDTGEVVFSGPMEEAEETFGVDQGHWTIRGRDDNGQLADRLALPSSDESYWAAVMVDHPVAYYRLGEPAASVTAVDASGNAHHGTYTGGITFGTPGPLTADVDTAITVDGSTGYVNIPHSPALNLTGDLSLECWVYPTTRANYQMLITKVVAAGITNNTFEFRCEITSGLPVLYQYAASASSVTATTAPPLNQWSHLMVVKSGATVTHYLNGQPNGTGTITGVVTTNTSPLKLAQRDDLVAGYTLNGRLDEVALYGTALSAARVLAHYSTGRQGPFAGQTYVGAVISDQPTVYYRLGEVVGPSAFDSSGNVRTATYVGTPTFGQPGAILDGDRAVLLGAGTYLNVPSIAFGAAITVEAWIKTASLGEQPIYSTRVGGATGQFYFGTTSGHVFIYCPDAGANITQIGVASVSDNKWHHLVWVNNGTTTWVYVDGVLDFTRAQAWTPSTAHTGWIGWDSPNVSEYFQGTLDDISVYPTALSSVRVGAHYAARNAGYDVRTGTVEAVMRGFADANAGSTALPARQIPGFALATFNGLGPTVTEQARFDNLLDLLRLLAIKGGTSVIPLGFRLQQTVGTPNQLVFTVYQPRDLTARVVYSPNLQNVVSYTHKAPKAPAANYIYVAGQGVLTGRPIVSASDTTSIASWGRRELFKDRRDTADSAILATSATQELSVQASKETATIEPYPVAGLLYGQDYGLGDRVSFVASNGQVLQQVVYEVDIQLSAEQGPRFLPRVGPPAALDPESSTAIVQSIDERLANLEAV